MKMYLLQPMCSSLVVIAVLLHSSRGQVPPTEKGPPPRFGHAVRSPEVHDDRRVTFRLRAPNAKEVFLAREGAKPAALRKDEKGVWSITTEPLPPDLYTYRFVVDGDPQADPTNTLAKAIVQGGHESIVHVPGPATLCWEWNDVPHGKLHRHFFQSKTLGETRDFWVYTPPGYDPAAQKKYRNRSPRCP